MAATETDQSTAGAHYFTLSLGGAEAAGFFREVDGIASENEVVVHTTSDAQGKSQVQKFPGQLKWNNITLKRGVDSNNALWTWRQQVINGQITDARKEVTITVIDWAGNTIVTYNFINAWPCRYSAPGLSAGGNEVMVEEIEIAHEGMTRQ
jgi:phage tail-like protein